MALNLSHILHHRIVGLWESGHIMPRGVATQDRQALFKEDPGTTSMPSPNAASGALMPGQMTPRPPATRHASPAARLR